MLITYSPRFSRQYKKLSREIRDKVKEREYIFRENPFDSQLKTHKLNGRLAGLWAFSVDYQTRIIFEFQNQNSVALHEIGGHEIY